MSLGRTDHKIRQRTRSRRGVPPSPRAGVAFLSAATLTLTLAAAGDARADGPVNPAGKGTVGGALLGGEVVTITMGAAGVSRGWPYFVFGGLGMVAGGVGGYFVDKKDAVSTSSMGVTTGGPAEPSLYMLAGGMALLIPALIVSLNATAYKPPDTDRGEPGNNEPATEPPKPVPAPGAAPPGAAPPPPTTTRNRFRTRGGGELASVPHIPVSVVDVYQGKLGMGLPAFQIRPLYTSDEMWKYGVAQGTEVRFPVFKAMF
jgi:hypothetical protein